MSYLQGSSIGFTPFHLLRVLNRQVLEGRQGHGREGDMSSEVRQRKTDRGGRGPVTQVSCPGLSPRLHLAQSGQAEEADLSSSSLSQDVGQLENGPAVGNLGNTDTAPR